MAVRRILTAIALLPGLSHASPRSDPTTGRAVFTGAATASPTSLNLSPAAIGIEPVSFALYFAATSTLEQLSIDTKHLDLDTGGLTNGARIRETEVAPGGDFAVLWRANDRLTVGGALRVPPPEMQPRDRDALQYQTLGVGERTYMASVGVSLRVIDAFYVGASLAHENTFLHLRYARDTALANGLGPNGITSDCNGAPCGLENPEATELYDVKVRSPWLATSNLRVTLGTAVRITPDVWLGIGYHTPPGFDIQTTLDGTMDVQRAPRDGGTLIKGGSTVYVQYPASIDGEVKALLPMALELHVGGRWQDLSRMKYYDVRGYNSTFAANDVPAQMLRARGLHDAFAGWVGIEQRTTSERKPFQLGARVGYETSSVDDDRLSALTVAPAAVTLDLGAQVHLGPWTVQLSYGIAYSPTIQVDKSAFDPRYQIECIDSGYDYKSRGCAATREGYGLDTAAGDYRRIDHSLRLGFRYDRL